MGKHFHLEQSLATSGNKKGTALNELSQSPQKTKNFFLNIMYKKANIN